MEFFGSKFSRCHKVQVQVAITTVVKFSHGLGIQLSNYKTTFLRV